MQKKINFLLLFLFMFMMPISILEKKKKKSTAEYCFLLFKFLQEFANFSPQHQIVSTIFHLYFLENKEFSETQLYEVHFTKRKKKKGKKQKPTKQNPPKTKHTTTANQNNKNKNEKKKTKVSFYSFMIQHIIYLFLHMFGDISLSLGAKYPKPLVLVLRTPELEFSAERHTLLKTAA